MDEKKLVQELLIRQYELIKSSRAALLNYCNQLTEEDFLTSNSSFGRGSIRNLLVHNANVYEFWLLRNILKINVDVRDFDSVRNVAECITYFQSVDQTVLNFIRHFDGMYEKKMDVTLGNRFLTLTPLQVFTHVVTHEFHHKGQILSLSRHLGYTPIDTDVIR
ncbi:DinB family protein [Pedobacter sp. Du54]|uniref:DinB family protein n=1 Tax=Pedobacter anseongensis TaxID=3133439 RepID=UPI0030B74739